MRKFFIIIPLAVAAVYGLMQLTTSCTEEGRAVNFPVPAFMPVKKETRVPQFRAELKEKQRVLDSIFTKQSTLGYFNGCVAVSYHDTLLYQKSFGCENISTKKELCCESSFQLASVSKMFTGVAIMKLVEQNKLSVKDPLEKYFPDFPYKGTTIEH